MLPRDSRLAGLAASALLTAPDETLRDAEGALRYARRAADLTPDDPRAMLTLAVALVITRRMIPAAAAAKRARRAGADPACCRLIEALADDAPATGRDVAEVLRPAGPASSRENISNTYHRLLADLLAERFGRSIPKERN